MDALREATQRTLDHYNHNAEDFFAGTRDHDVQQNMDALLQFIEGLAAIIASVVLSNAPIIYCNA